MHYANEWKNSFEEARNGEIKTVAEIKRGGREVKGDATKIEINVDEWGVKKGRAKKDEKGVRKRQVRRVGTSFAGESWW